MSGNDRGKPASGPVAAEIDDAEPAPFTKEGDYIIFGHYEQDGDTSNGPETIEGEVPEEEGGMACALLYISEINVFFDD